MPEIQVRPAISSDIPALMALDHNYSSDYAWQMEMLRDDEQVSVRFRQVKLPRSARVEYPRSPHLLADEWTRRSGLLVATLENEIIGYIALMLHVAPLTAWVTDLAVLRRARRQGIGSALVWAGQEWGRNHDCARMVLEMQPKNYAAICMAQKLGFEFCGYNDLFYASHDIALFFAKGLR